MKIRDLFKAACAALVILLAAGSSMAASNCKNANTTIEIEQCAAKELAFEERELSKVYKEVMGNTLNQPDSGLEQYSVMRKTLQASQSAWVKFRDAQCDAVYAYNMGGTVRGLEALSCKISLTKARTAQLVQTYLETR